MGFLFRKKGNFGIRMLSFILSDMIFFVASIMISGYIFKFVERGWNIEYADYIKQLLRYLPQGLVFLAVFVGLNYLFGLYSGLWKYAGVTEIITLFMVLNLEFGLLFVFTLAFDINIPFFTFPMSVIMCFIAMTFSRMWYRVVIRSRHLLFSGSRELHFKKVMVVGVGDAGSLIIRSMTHDPKKRGMPVVIVDDDPDKQGTSFLGVPVEGTRDDIPELVEKHKVDRIIIAIPSANTVQLKELLDICVNTGKEVLKSDISEMFNDSLEDAGNYIPSGEGNMPSLRLQSIKPEDLLGREPVELSHKSLEYISDKVVLVSGGAGSIGSEICRQLCKLNPAKIIIYDIDENGTYEVEQEFVRKHKDVNLHVIIGSIRDEDKLNDVFKEHKPDVVFHAAAHKHVPLMEGDPAEAIKNNVFGTLNLCNAALKAQTEHFILISTDKAVNPTNVMGASKRMCEFIIKGMNVKVKNSEGKYKTTFAAVRFGNVLGSHGSVIPLFKKQLAEGGPITITDKRMTRYFMTIPEASMLVIDAGSMALGGEIFILDMGTPVKIDDMARKMIRLAGYIPDIDIKIEYVGLRPGEKLFEELSTETEALDKTDIEKINVARDYCVTYEDMEEKIHILTEAISRKTDMREAIKLAVPTYTPDENGTD